MKPLFCVRDRKAQLFLKPFTEATKVHAYRAFEQACKEPGSAFGAYPDDFELIYMGTFDESSGRVNQLDHFEILATPRDFINVVPVEPAAPGMRSVGPTAPSAKAVKQ